MPIRRRDFITNAAAAGGAHLLGATRATDPGLFHVLQLPAGKVGDNQPGWLLNALAIPIR